MPRGGSLVIIILSIALTAHAQEALAPFVPPNANSASGNVLRGQLLWGRTDSWPGAPDFFCRQSNSQSNVLHPLADGTPKCYAKGMVLGDIGDSPDLVLRRAGPDGADFNGKPQPYQMVRCWAPSTGRRGARAASRDNRVSGRAAAETAVPHRYTRAVPGIRRARLGPEVCIWQRHRPATMGVPWTDL